MWRLASDLWLSYLIQETEDHDGEGGYQADVTPPGVVTLAFNPLKLSADNEASLARWLGAAVTRQKRSSGACGKTRTTYSHLLLSCCF